MKSGKPPSGGSRQQLGKRDRTIVADVVRYKLTTNELIHQRYLPEASINAVTKITFRLTAAGWLQRHTLVGSQLYFVPSRTTCRHFALPDFPLSPIGSANIGHESYHRTVLPNIVTGLPPGRQWRFGTVLGLDTAEVAYVALCHVPRWRYRTTASHSS